MNKICAFIKKFYLIFYLLFGLPLLAAFFWLIAGKSLSLPIYVSDSRLHLIIVPLIELLFVTFSLHNLCVVSKKDRKGAIWFLVLIFSIVNLILVILLRSYYLEHTDINNLKIRFAMIIAVGAILILFLAAVFSLIKTIQYLKRLGSGLDEQEEILPIRTLRQIKAIWNHFWKDPSPQSRKFTLIFLGICFVLGLTLRLINIGQLPPYVDEYAHTRSAYRLISEGTFGYSRAFVTVTLPVFLSMKIFGQSLWAARFPMVLLNMAAMFPLYALTKKMNKKVGYISVLLFTLSPWIIGVGKSIREYAVAPLFFYSISWLLVDLLDWEKCSAKQYIKKNWLRAAILLLILIYTIYDRRSVLIINLGIFVVFSLFAILKILKHKTSKWLNLAVILGGLISSVLVLYQGGFLRRLLRDPSDFFRWNNQFVSVNFRSGYQQWYALGFLGFIIVGFVALIAIRPLFKKYDKADTLASFSFLTFVAFTVGIAIRIPRGGFRYGVLPHYWYVIVVAIFLYGIFVILQKMFKRKWLGTLLWVLIFLGLFTNYSGIYQSVVYTGGPASPVTRETHSIVEPALDFLHENISENDILLTDTIQSYGEIVGKTLSGVEIVNVNSIHADDTISAMDYVNDNPSGWIVVAPHAKPWMSDVPEEDIVINGRSISFHGTIGDMFVWHWTTPGP
jgi:hypothetical protein